MKTIGEIFEESVKNYPDNIALKKREDVYTYRQLKDRVLAVKHHLYSLGLNPGERFAVLGENSPEWAISYLGILRAGLVCVPLDALHSEAELIHILRESGARGVISSETHMYKIDSIKGELKELKWIINMKEIRNLHAPGKEVKIEIDPDSLAVLIFTSGTTGLAKAVMLSHKNIISNLQSIEKIIPIYHTDSLVSIIPMHHTFEATCGFLYPLYCGASIFYPPSLKPTDLIATFKEAKITCLIAVPLLFEKFLTGLQRKIASSSIPTKLAFTTISGVASIFKFLSRPLFSRVRKEMGLERLRLAVSGGAALSSKVFRGLEMLGIPILQGYGLTEAAPVVSVNPPERPKNDSVGKPLPGVEVRIHEPDEYGIGELIVKGPNVMLGYYNNEKATAEVLKDGWLYTGDLGYIDNEGYIHITGRKKSLIVTPAGKNIIPEELEEKLLESKWIKEVLVVPRIDATTKKEEVCALVYPNYELLEEYSIAHNITLELADIERIIREEIKKVNEKLPAYKRITKFEIREEEFPKTTTQKIKRHMFIERSIKV
ncbi:MAG: AMP-binding protein [candidate division WOR-3 bacterium]|nr:AMP-binding protein [candidate division WOR-3 bacterium]